VASRWTKPEILLAIWGLLALAALLPVTTRLAGSFPLFTVLWIVVPLVAVARTRDASRVGFRAIPWRDFVWVSAINCGGLLLVTLLFEPWSHTYEMLVKAALSGDHPDTTFAWLLRLPRLPALGAMFLYSGTVTLFGEELFFRGWLLQFLQKRWGTPWAIIAQALLFTIPNLLASLALPPLQGILYALVYTFLAIGLIGGWAAARTKSVWPSLFSATVFNLAFVALIV
jgi:membrane protease YdiL (CAAX protease family)